MQLKRIEKGNRENKNKNLIAINFSTKRVTTFISILNIVSAVCPLQLLFSIKRSSQAIFNCLPRHRQPCIVGQTRPFNSFTKQSVLILVSVENFFHHQLHAYPCLLSKINPTPESVKNLPYHGFPASIDFLMQGIKLFLKKAHETAVDRK